MKKVSLATKNPTYGKLEPNWEGPRKVINCKRQGSCYLETLDERKLEHPCGSEVVILTEVHMTNHRVMKYQEEDNEEQLRLNLDLIDEVRMDAEQKTARYKNLMARQYDAMVKPKRFNIGDLVLKRVFLATKNPAYGKLEPNWEGPYKVINYKRRGSYYLETLDGRKLEHPWNVEHLRRYYQ